MENKRALVFGGNTGMDGTLLVDLLKSKNYDVHPIPGRSTKSEISNSIEYFHPHEVYNLAGYSNTFFPFDHIDEMIAANLTLPANILGTILSVDKRIKFFNASSCLIFGKDASGLQNEETPINPSHPYGCIKAATQSLIKMYREEKGLFACSGIYFPHESPRRKPDFFTKKVCMAVARIKLGSEEKIKISKHKPAQRDWSHSKDAVEAAWMMLQNKKPEDFVIGSGILHTTDDFILSALTHAGLKWKEHVEFSNDIERPNDILPLRADITKIQKTLGWHPKHSFSQIIEEMVDFEIEQLKNKNI